MNIDLLMYITFIVVGLAGLAYSADKFVDGASNLSLNLNVSPIIVGVIIVGIGTSAPEILVSASSAMDGKAQLALGNAIGSNIANIAFIIGFTAMLMMIRVSRQLIKKEFLLMIGTTILGAFLISDGQLTRFDGFLLLFTFVFVLYYLIGNAKESQKSIKKEQEKNNKEVQEETQTPKAEMGIKKSVLVTIIGMIALVGFSQLLVHGAVEVATFFGVSELVIGLTILAIGTSLPELSASLAAVRKNSPDLAIGNVLGSNIFNIVAVLSVASLIQPFAVEESVLTRDLPLLIALSFAFIIVSFSAKGDGKINRFEGFMFLSVFIGYLVMLVGESMGWFSLNELYSLYVSTPTTTS